MKMTLKKSQINASQVGLREMNDSEIVREVRQKKPVINPRIYNDFKKETSVNKGVRDEEEESPIPQTPIVDDINLIFKNDADEFEDFYAKYDKNGFDVIENGKAFIERHKVDETGYSVEREDKQLDKSNQFELPADSVYLPVGAYKPSYNEKEAEIIESKHEEYRENVGVTDEVFTHGKTLPVSNKLKELEDESKVERKYYDDFDFDRKREETDASPKNTQNNLFNDQESVDHEEQQNEYQKPDQSMDKSRENRSVSRRDRDYSLSADDRSVSKRSKSVDRGMQLDSNDLKEHSIKAKKTEFDDIPLANREKKTFEQLLEEQLKLEGHTAPPIQNNKPKPNKPKKQFLRKNQGLNVTNRLKNKKSFTRRPDSSEKEEKATKTSTKPKRAPKKADKRKKERKSRSPSVQSKNESFSANERRSKNVREEEPIRSKIMNEINEVFSNEKDNQSQPVIRQKNKKELFRDENPIIDESMAEFKRLESLNKKNYQKDNYLFNNSREEENRSVSPKMAYLRKYSPIDKPEDMEEDNKQLFKDIFNDNEEIRQEEEDIEIELVSEIGRAHV